MRRRVLAAAITVRLFASAFSVFFLSATAILEVAIAHLLRLPLPCVLERRWPGQPGQPSLLRYGLLGALLGCVALAV